MRAHLELFARLFIDMRAAQHRISLDAGRHGDGPAHPGVGPLGVVDDFLRRRIQRPMVIGFHSNSNPITGHKFSIFALTSCPNWTNSFSVPSAKSRWREDFIRKIAGVK